MLTRLRVRGFKNLVDVEVSFGPFTCIAGANGVGKSNLFDAITFLSALSEKTLIEAAFSVRSESARAGDVRSIFRHVHDAWADEVSFEVDMLVPSEGRDDLGQRATATSTFLRYSLTIVREHNEEEQTDRLRIRHEELVHVKLEDARRLLPFGSPAWQKSVVRGRRTTPFISTSERPHGHLIRLHSEGGKKNRPKEYAARDLPRTVLSSANAVESPTALLARREMQSWRLLQMEPSALRAPDSFSAVSRISSSGAHVPATLSRLAHVHRRDSLARGNGSAVYARIANRLAELVESVRAVRVDADEKRELLSLVVTDRSGTEHEARALSDGTLRFLALAVLESDPEAVGLVCLEEPENGIHPDRVPAMLRLLKDLAVDPRGPIGADNPLRQVIVNTHSPAVVATCHDSDLIVASAEPTRDKTLAGDAASFQWLEHTWRARFSKRRPVARSRLLAYLSPQSPDSGDQGAATGLDFAPVRVMDRPDMQLFLPL